MALVVNVDTYVTIAEANQYVSNYYLSSDPLRIQWEAMDEADKEVMLRKAFVQINSLPYTGRPAKPHQPNPFPRCSNFSVADMQKVKYAQVEQSMSISDPVAEQETVDRINLRRAGVVQYTIGDLSERFQSGLPEDSNATFFGLSEKAYKYLREWLQGGYHICISTKRHYGNRL